MSTYDEIRLLGIGGYGYHGVLASERQEGQPFHADLTLYLDTTEAARTDTLGHTADYSAVAQAVVGVIEGEPANLIETLAARIADAVLAFGVAKVEVTVHKPQAPLGVPFSDVQVKVIRSGPTGASTGSAGPGVADLSQTEQPAAPAEPEVSPEAPPLVPPLPVPAPAAAGPLADNEGIPSTNGGDDPDKLESAPEEPVKVVLGLGGNLGDVRQTLREAVEDLAKTPGIQVTDVSALARTAAVTHDDAVAQADFLNAVVLAETTLSPRELLEAAHRIEDNHGRVRVERWGDRTLDIDIITYGDLESSQADLTLPHLRASQRAFVLIPWAQVDPVAQLPGEDGGKVAELAERAPDRQGVRWLALDWLEEGLDKTTAAPAAPSAPAPPAAPPAAQPAPAPPAESDPAEPEHPADDLQPADPSALGEPSLLPEVAPPHAEQGPPAVADWLANEPEVTPEYGDAQPAVALPPPATADDAPTAPPQQGDDQRADAPEAENEETDNQNTEAQEKGDAASPAVDWLAEDPESAPLSAPPQWLKVRREE